MSPDIFSRRINGSAVPEFAARYSEGAVYQCAGAHEAASGWDLCYEFQKAALIRLLTVLAEACDWKMYPDIFSRRINGSAVPEFVFARYWEGAMFHCAGSYEAASGWDLCYEFSRELALIRLLTVLTEACDW
ncbi:hypothetical protein CEXT_685621 [Caerostris extrusa]|uniref:Uncharacterized protein n=1 Tax=Caerostris extrusa TaxID=172846 RepID=A0AAV4S168_CAEEX|nr:hypothetical protein CEXT_685621 [Caerostris extrusa]